MSKGINILQGQSTEDLMAELKSRGKFVDNLWTTEDVKSKFNCTEDEAQEVLYEALTNEATMEQIWFAIDFHGNENELTEKDDTSY
tara:strand:+ start:2068 stop:2325 length:258 start_codon:yes stop_codon:yes gene_type:complete